MEISSILRRIIVFFLLVPLAFVCAQDVCVYVVEPRDGYVPSPPYTNWTMAATCVISAVNTAVANGWTNVVVSNGTYYLTNQISIASKLYMRSWHDGVLDATNTILNGNNYPGKPITNRVLYVNHTNALVEGFTICNGYKDSSGDSYGGGGVYLSGGILQNCLVMSNYSSGNGGGVYIRLQGLVRHCEIITNVAAGLGGGVSGFYTGVVECCLIASNCALGATDGGGGIYMRYGGFVSNCHIRENFSASRGGGVFLYDGASASHCKIAYNNAASEGGGVYIRTGKTLSNCLIINNTSPTGGGIYVRDTLTNIVQCTVAGNHASGSGGGIYCYDNYIQKGPVINCIVYDNTAGMATSNHGNSAGAWLPWTNSCTAPVATLAGTNNISDAPQWVSRSEGDFHLKKTSPCLNAGFMWNGVEGTRVLDGNPRVDRLMRRVDMGAFEYRYDGTFMLVY